MSGERDELDGEVAGVGAEDEAAFVEVDEAEQERGAAADGVECGLVGAVGSQRVVVAIEDGDGSRGEDGVHCGGLLGVARMATKRCQWAWVVEALARLSWRREAET